MDARDITLRSPFRISAPAGGSIRIGCFNIFSPSIAIWARRGTSSFFAIPLGMRNEFTVSCVDLNTDLQTARDKKRDANRDALVPLVRITIHAPSGALATASG